MPELCRVTDDLTTGHLCTTITQIGSSNTDNSVIANGLPAIVIGAPTVVHTNPPVPLCPNHVANLNAGSNGLAGCGTQTAGLAIGGKVPGYSAKVEQYDGSSWSSGGNLATARSELAGAGTQSSGLCAGGTTGSNSNVTEEYDTIGTYALLFNAVGGL